jgi:hypothetical protein
MGRRFLLEIFLELRRTVLGTEMGRKFVLALLLIFLEFLRRVLPRTYANEGIYI